MKLQCVQIITSADFRKLKSEVVVLLWGLFPDKVHDHADELASHVSSCNSKIR